MILDLNIEDPRWQMIDLESLAIRAAKQSLTHLSINAGPCEISLLACNDARIARLNEGFRDRARATNVLSWPSTNLAAPIPGATPVLPHPEATGEMPLGDIAIAWETCEQEAQTAGKPMSEHVTHLLVHGVLHLLGYDHIRDPDATLMMQKEVEILGKLGIDNPY